MMMVMMKMGVNLVRLHGFYFSMTTRISKDLTGLSRWFSAPVRSGVFYFFPFGLQYLSNQATIRSNRSTRCWGSPPRLISWPSRG